MHLPNSRSLTDSPCKTINKPQVDVHADGTEVWLEGDFVRLVRPRSPSSPSGTSTVAQQEQQQRRRQGLTEPRLLHVSVASTVHFRVPSLAPPPPPPPPTSEHAGGSITAAVATSPPESRSIELNPDGVFANSGGGTAAAAAADRGMVIMSLGDIASRALALRRQFMTYSTATAATGGGGETGTRAGTGTGSRNRTSTALRTRKYPNVTVKIKPPMIFPTMPGGAAAAATGLSPPFRVPVAAATRAANWPISETSTTSTRWQRQQARSSVAATATAAAHTSAAAAAPQEHFARMATTIVESVERGGASFVAFPDGRARGAFADRTIVTLGARISYLPLPLHEHHRGGNARRDGGGGSRLRGCGTATAAAAAATGVLDLPCYLSGVDRGEQEHDREIECICPNGMVLRLTEQSIGCRQRGGFGTDGIAGKMSLGGTTGGGGGGSDSGFSTATAPAIGGDRRGIDTNICSNGRSSSSDTVFRPYVVAVLHFAEWAATPPAERRAATEREAAGRMVAAAEAERNRRFVDLHRLAKPAPSAPSPRTCHTKLNHQRTSGSTSWSASGGRAFTCDGGRRGGGGEGGGEGGGGRRRSGSGLLRQGAADRDNNTGQDGEDNKENTDKVFKSFFFNERQQGVVMEPPSQPPQRARQRNALVARLLEANREVLIGRDMSTMLAQADF